MSSIKSLISVGNPHPTDSAFTSGVSLLLENVRSASNIGAIFRTSDALKIDRIFLCGICAVPPNREILKTALGATESVAWEYHQSAFDLLTSLKKMNIYQCIAIEQDQKSISLDSFIPDNGKNILMILGNEISGVSREILSASDAIIEIPQFGMKKSLNVAVAAGIAIWEVTKKKRIQPL